MQFHDSVAPTRELVASCLQDYTRLMVTSDAKLAPRRFGRMDAGRSAVSLIALAVSFAAWYVLLPRIQAVILPTSPGDATDRWVVAPHFAVRLGACAIASAVSVPFLLRRFRKR